MEDAMRDAGDEAGLREAVRPSSREDCFVSLSHTLIANDTGVSKRHVQNMLEDLIARGLVEVIRQPTPRKEAKYKVVYRPDPAAMKPVLEVKPLPLSVEPSSTVSSSEFQSEVKQAPPRVAASSTTTTNTTNDQSARPKATTTAESFRPSVPVKKEEAKKPAAKVEKKAWTEQEVREALVLDAKGNITFPPLEPQRPDEDWSDFRHRESEHDRLCQALRSQWFSDRLAERTRARAG